MMAQTNIKILLCFVPNFPSSFFVYCTCSQRVIPKKVVFYSFV